MRGIALSLAIAASFPAFAARAQAETLFETNLAGTEAYRFPLPLPAGFRLSGGVAVNGNQVSVNALANGTSTVTINKVTWSDGGSIANSRVGLKDMAPYGGLGYTKTFGGGFKLNWDAGALFGAPIMPRPLMLGLPENLALQNDYLESHTHTVAVAPVAEVTLSLKF
ncbi:MAG TPA: hypothetical protein VKP60_08230 [Magnetospirillaceae bacterium]|nr:hypothetical protein [Magnetospirillaceae bacterium]